MSAVERHDAAPLPVSDRLALVEAQLDLMAERYSDLRGDVEGLRPEVDDVRRDAAIVDQRAERRRLVLRAFALVWVSLVLAVVFLVHALIEGVTG